MTTEHHGSKREALLRFSSLELRLYVAALLAAVYTISWRAIGGHALPIATEPAVAAPLPREPYFVWLDNLPPTARPAVALPAGWQLASEPATSPAQPPRVVRIPSQRAPRVRTRSS